METKPVLEVLDDEDDYLEWSVRVKAYLMAQDLWDVVEATNEPPTPEYEAASKAWRKMNALALHVIQISCGPATFSDIREITSARIAWETLAEKYKPKGPDPSSSMASVPLEEVKLDSSTEPGESDKKGNIHDGVKIYLDLYKALQIADWNAANKFLKRHPRAISAKITGTDKTALHVAAEAGHVHIVEELVKLMCEENLEIKDCHGLTALAWATANGQSRMVEFMLGKNENLISIGDRAGYIPVYLALVNGHLKLARYLYLRTPIEILNPENSAVGAGLVCVAIYNNALDIALDLVSRCPHLAVAQDKRGRTPFLALAAMPNYFPSGNRLVFWKRWIYSGIHIHELGGTTNDFRLNIEKLAGNGSRSNCKEITGLGIYSLSQLVSKLRTVLGIEHLYELKLAHFLSRKLLSLMMDQILISNTQQRTTGKVYGAIVRAVKEGIFEFVFDIGKANPDLVWSHDEKSTSIFSVAVQYRHAKIFSLIYGLDTKHFLACCTDSFYRNNLLHMAGMSAPSTSLNHLPGAALQMQRELQWFKIVSTKDGGVHRFLDRGKGDQILIAHGLLGMSYSDWILTC